jgi:mandelate racemase
MIKIRKLLVRAVAAPMPMPLQTASGAVSTALLILIDLETTEGITGRAYLQSYTRASLSPMVDLVRNMGEMIEGDPLAPFEIEAKLRQKFKLLGVHNIVLIAMAGIDMAAWDALAQSLGVPLVTALGGTPKPVRAYNSKGLGIMPVKKLAKEAMALLREGFSAVKLRLGRADPREDVAAVRAVKKAIGDEMTLMVDYNQALTFNDAILRGRMLDAEGGLHWIEEPTRADDFAGNARIADELDTPVQIGENFMGPEQMAQALGARACDYVMPDAQRIGGVTGWMRAAALAQGAGIEMSSHLFPEISVHLLGVTPTCHWLEYVDWAAPILAEPLVVKKGLAVIPELPGSGMRWNEKAVGKYLL